MPVKDTLRQAWHDLKKAITKNNDFDVEIINKKF
jgi:hypothetical protein